MRTVVIPSGDKPSVVADAPEDYAKDTSPDKVSPSISHLLVLTRVFTQLFFVIFR